jgi:hypothetical protein
VRSARTRGLGALHTLRTLGMRAQLAQLQAIRARIAGDPEMRGFLEGRSPRLPAFYREQMKQRLGSYAELLSEEDMRPQLEPPGSAAKSAEAAEPAEPKMVTLGGRRPRVSAAV